MPRPQLVTANNANLQGGERSPPSCLQRLAVTKSIHVNSLFFDIASIKAILFDLDDTLLDHTYAAREGLRELHKHFDEIFGCVPFNELNAHFSAVNGDLWKRYASGEIVLEQLRNGRMKALVEISEERSGIARSVDLEEMGTFYLERYVENVRPLDGVIRLVDHLSRNRRLAIVSNGFSSLQAAKLECGGIGDYFDCCIFSDAVGLWKPDPRIFQLALDTIGVSASEAIYVGDNFFHDIRGAASIGLRTVWYNPGDSLDHLDFPDTTPDAVARSIAELGELFGLDISTFSSEPR